jgi:hypothetical protein
MYSLTSLCYNSPVVAEEEVLKRDVNKFSEKESRRQYKVEDSIRTTR